MLATVVALSVATLAMFDGVAEAQGFVTASATTSPEYTQNNPMLSQPTSEPTAHLVVMPGDSLWSISQGQVHPDASPQQVMHGVERIFELNRDRIGDDPNYILPGQELLLPPVSEPTTATAPTTAEPTTVVEPAVVAGASGSVAEPADLPDLPQMEAEPAAPYTTSAASSPEYYFMGVESRMLAATAAGVGMGMIMLALVLAIIIMWRGEYGRYSENYALPVSSSDLKDALSPPSPSHADTRGPMSLVPADRSNGHSTNEHSSNKLAMVQKKADVAHPETLPTSLRALEADVRRSGKTASSAILFPVVEDEYYTPPQAARVLKLSRQRITQMLQSGEMEGTQDPESRRWRIPQSVVHARLKDRPARRRSNDEGSQSAPEGSQRLRELEVEVRDLSYRLGRSEALLEFTESTLHAERDRLLEELKRERERADRLERELEEARRQARP
jgi:excisionase family DNA binding protein